MALDLNGKLGFAVDTSGLVTAEKAMAKTLKQAEDLAAALGKIKAPNVSAGSSASQGKSSGSSSASSSSSGASSSSQATAEAKKAQQAIADLQRQIELMQKGLDASIAKAVVSFEKLKDATAQNIAEFTKLKNNVKDFAREQKEINNFGNDAYLASIKAQQKAVVDLTKLLQKQKDEELALARLEADSEARRLRSELSLQQSLAITENKARARAAALGASQQNTFGNDTFARLEKEKQAQIDLAHAQGLVENSALREADALRLQQKYLEATKDSSIAARAAKLKMQGASDAAVQGYIQEAQNLRVLQDEVKKASAVVAGAEGPFGSFGKVLRNVFNFTLGFGFFNAIKSSVTGLYGVAVQTDKVELALRTATGSAAQAKEEFSRLRGVAEALGLPILSLAQGFADFKIAAGSTKLSAQQVSTAFDDMATASAGFGLPAEQFEGVMRAITQIMSKGTVQAEELRGQLGDRLPGAFSLAARSLGISAQQLDHDMKNGLISSEKFIPVFANLLATIAGPAAAARLGTVGGSFQNLSNQVTKTSLAIRDAGLDKLLVGTFNAIAGVVDFVTDHLGLFSGALKTVAYATAAYVVILTGAAVKSLAFAAAVGLETIALTALGITADASAVSVGRFGKALAFINANPIIVGLTILGTVLFATYQHFAAAGEHLDDLKKTMEGTTPAIESLKVGLEDLGKTDLKGLSFDVLQDYAKNIESGTADINVKAKAAEDRITLLRTRLKQLSLSDPALSFKLGIDLDTTQQALDGYTTQLNKAASETARLAAVDSKFDPSTSFAFNLAGLSFTGLIAQLGIVLEQQKKINDQPFSLEVPQPTGSHFKDLQEELAAAQKGAEAYQLFKDKKKALTEVKEDKAPLEFLDKYIFLVTNTREATEKLTAAKKADKKEESDLQKLQKKLDILKATGAFMAEGLRLEDARIAATAKVAGADTAAATALGKYNEQLRIREGILSDRDSLKAQSDELDTINGLLKVGVGLQEAQIKAKLAYNLLNIKPQNKTDTEQKGAQQAIDQAKLNAGTELDNLAKNRANSVENEISLNKKNVQALSEINDVELARQIAAGEYNVIQAKRIQQSNIELEAAKRLAQAEIDRAKNPLGELATFDFSSLFGSIGNPFKEAINGLADLSAMQIKYNTEKEAAAGNQELLTALDSEYAKNSIKNTAKLLSASKSLFSQKTGAYKVITAAEKAFRIIELAGQAKSIAVGVAAAATSIANAVAVGYAWAATAIANASAQPGPAAFVGFAAMAALMASIGFARGGSNGGSYKAPVAGAGNVLGDPTAQDQSLKNSLEHLETISQSNLGVAVQQLAALRALVQGIGGVSAQLYQANRSTGGPTPFSAYQASDSRPIGAAKLAGGAVGANYGGYAGAAIGGAFLGPLGAIGGGALGAILGGALGSYGGKLLGSLLGSKKSKVDEGVQLGVNDKGQNQTLASVLGGKLDSFYYAVIHTNRKFSHDSDDLNLAKLDDGITQQFQQLVVGITNTVTDSAKKFFGVSESKITDVLNNFNLGKALGQISSQGKTSEEFAAEVSAAFANLGKELTEQLIPGLDKFQKTGEGLFETLTRVVAEAGVIKNTFSLLGITVTGFGLDLVKTTQDIIDLLGGFDTATSSLGDYLDFTRTKDQIKAATTDLLDSLSNTLGIGLIRTADDLAKIVNPALSAVANGIGTDLDKAIISALPQLTGLTSAIADSAQAALEARQSFDDNIKSQLDSANAGKSFAVDLQQLDSSFADLRAQAVQTGGNLVAVEQLYGIKRADLVQKYADQEAQALADAQKAVATFINSLRSLKTNLVKELLDLNGGISSFFSTQQIMQQIQAATTSDGVQSLIQPLFDSIKQSYTDSAAAVQAQIDAVQKLKDDAKGLRDYVEGLKVDSRFGTPDQTQKAAQKQFNALAVAAKGGDASSLSKLQDAASTLLDIGAGNAQTPVELAKLRASVVNTLNQVATGIEALPTQQEQLQTLKDAFSSQIVLVIQALDALENAGQTASANTVQGISSALVSGLVPLQNITEQVRAQTLAATQAVTAGASSTTAAVTASGTSISTATNAVKAAVTTGTTSVVGATNSVATAALGTTSAVNTSASNTIGSLNAASTYQANVNSLLSGQVQTAVNNGTTTGNAAVQGATGSIDAVNAQILAGFGLSNTKLNSIDASTVQVQTNTASTSTNTANTTSSSNTGNAIAQDQNTKLNKLDWYNSQNLVTKSLFNTVLSLSALLGGIDNLNARVGVLTTVEAAQFARDYGTGNGSPARAVVDAVFNSLNASGTSSIYASPYNIYSSGAYNIQAQQQAGTLYNNNDYQNLRTPSATGNVFMDGAVKRYADGGAFTNSVVTKPVTFNMGLMGEAGPEAIMPLQRLPDGTLGVYSTGGSKSSGNSYEICSEIRELRQELRQLRTDNSSENRALVQNSGKVVKIIERITDGESIYTKILV